MGHAVAQLIEALRYNPEGRGFDSRWCHLVFFNWHNSFGPHYGPGVDSASNGNEYQEYFLGGKGGRCVRLTTLPTSCADCLEIWDPQPPGIFRACPGQNTDCFTFTVLNYTQRGMLLVAQLVETLRYKPEGRGFDSRWCHWNFSLT